MDSKRAYLTRRLFQFSNLVWKISLEDDEPRIVLEKGATELQIEKFVAPPLTGGEQLR
jgi:hypothetical protein